MDGHVGVRLSLEGNKTLTIALTDLVLNDPARKKSNRASSCWPLKGAPSKESIPFYNILWAELSDGHINVECAMPCSTRLTVEKLSFAVDPFEMQMDEGDKNSPAQNFVLAVLDRAYGDAKRCKRAYVLVNPKSGPGGAVRKWHQEIKPLLEAARMTTDVVILQRGGEALALARALDIDKYDTVMACSGDGTPHEIFNGLAQRPDAKVALAKTAVSHVPCGSGNAMACNLYGSSYSSFATLAIIKGIVTPLDLVSITQGDRRIISFLSQSLGIVAESDLGTEHLRCLGSTRFEIGLATRLFQKKCYPCDLAVKMEAEDKKGVKAHYKRHASDASSQPMTAADDVVGEEGLPDLKYGTVQDALPEGWELVSYDRIGNFYCGNMAYMAPNANFFTAALAADGCMDLVTVNGDIPVLHAVQVLLDVEAGRFFDNPNVKYQKISAYRIIPRNQQDGFISIDGERVPFEPFQAEVHQGLGRVISKKGGFEAEGPRGWDKVRLADRIHA